MEKNLESVQNVTLDKFKGTFEILPGNFILLENSLISVSNNKFIIMIDRIKNKIFEFNIVNRKLSRYDNKLLPHLELYIDSVKKINVDEYEDGYTNNIESLLFDALKFDTPTVLYLSIDDEKKGNFMIKNKNYQPAFTMVKKSPNFILG